MSNFFAALDDSGDEGEVQQKQNKTPAISSSKTQDRQPRKGSGARDSSDRRQNNDRGGRGGRTAPRDGKRAYDRRSGTGRGRETKKDGGGSHNWGSEKNEARKAEGHIDDEQKLSVNKEGNEEAAAANDNNNEESKKEEIDEEAQKAIEEEEERRRKEEEEEAKKMTYEEYLARKSEEQKDSEAFRELEVKELENNDFAGVKPKVAIKDENFLVMGGGKSLRKKGSKADKEATKVITSFRVADSSSGRRDGRDGDRRGGDRRDGDRRGGDRRDSDRRGVDRRGGDRRYQGDRGDRRDGRGGRGDRRDGRGGRGGGGRHSGGYSHKKEIDVGDMNSFPSL